MSDDPCRDFFLQPSCPAQRQYEALRCVFLDGCQQKEVAQRFGYDYDAFRQLVRQFRSACSAGTPPPFSSPNAGAGLSPRPTRQTAP
jgi:transposase